MKTLSDTPTDLEWLTGGLPPHRPIERRSEADYYGASDLIVAALGYASAPRSVASWKHGVSYEREFEFPELLLTEGNRVTRHLVANDWQVGALRRRGYLRVHAVGVPFLYVGPSGAARVPGSLLVMPAHSLSGARHVFDENEYADLVRSIEGRFSVVAACIGSSDPRKEGWTKAFQDRGIPWISGASSHDGNALRRIARLFDTFEYVTTNVLGSHVAYAAHRGSKVSIWGRYGSYRVDDFKGIPWYEKNWSRFAQRAERLSEEYVRSKHPQLFRNPWEADSLAKWAQPFLGAQCARGPLEVAGLLGWSSPGQAEVLVHRVSRKCADLAKAATRRAGRLLARTSSNTA